MSGKTLYEWKLAAKAVRFAYWHVQGTGLSWTLISKNLER